MDYDASAQYYNSTNFSRDVWVDMICSNIDKVGPVLYAGEESGKNVGHCFVLDGYDEDGNIHINWGWGGTDNGYFAFPDFGDFPAKHASIFNLRPNQGGEAVDVLVLQVYNGIKGIEVPDPLQLKRTSNLK